jgi:hypothetical protein
MASGLQFLLSDDLYIALSTRRGLRRSSRYPTHPSRHHPSWLRLCVLGAAESMSRFPHHSKQFSLFAPVFYFDVYDNN